MKALLLTSLLLLACTSWARASQSQHAVRLCGRELVRAIVYTCGGSRWRRNLSEFSGDDGEMDRTQSFAAGSQTKRLRSLDTEVSVKCCKVGCGKHDLTLLC
ncbi:insulin-like 5b [Brachyhypopomus gauderio]|uniref:insulin-like 5b n=1 Tax=Brachyhypopomus gauderio TaxID=698409 RepID=UPI004041B388